MSCVVRFACGETSTNISFMLDPLQGLSCGGAGDDLTALWGGEEAQRPGARSCKRGGARGRGRG